LGLSFEAERVEFLSSDSPILTIKSLAFTGAAILLKSRAAYTLTSLAANKAQAPPNISPVPAARALNNPKERHMYPVTQNVFPEKKPLKPFPYHFGNPPALLRTMDSLGLVPAAIKASVTTLCANSQRLGNGGYRVDVQELDAVLAQYDVSLQKRMQLKAAMSQQGLL
jgi:hypothetical protein